VNDMSDTECAELREWTLNAFDAAVFAGFIVPPWHPTDGIRKLFHGYYISGLTPAEAAQAAFGVHH
jgi:hypothetical protein